MLVRLITENDLETRVKWMNDPRIYVNMGFTPPITIENTIKWFHKNETLNNRIDVVYENNNIIIGFGGVTQIDWSLRCGETYTFIDPLLHGKGYGTRANRLLIDFAFTRIKLNKLCSHVDASNIASRKVREKLGFSLEGIIRDAKLLNGELIDRYYYGYLRRDYETQDIDILKIKIDNNDVIKISDDVISKLGS